MKRILAVYAVDLGALGMKRDAIALVGYMHYLWAESGADELGACVLRDAT